jgi:Uma2 family endonuclease
MMTAPLPDWLRPPPGGFTAEDLDRIPGLPPHTELVDGSLVFMAPQTAFHALVMDLIVTGLRRTVPPHLKIRREMSIILGHRQRPEPDVFAVRAEGIKSPAETAYQAGSIVLTVEVVSPDSEERDRERKPQLYAKAGIPHFWRVENNDGRPTVYVYELDPSTRSYALTSIHHDQLKLTVPFDIRIDLTEIDQL